MSLKWACDFFALPADKPLFMPVDAVLIGRRNNPEDKAAHIRGLAVYNPIHYQELPELFMDFICSLTGKSSKHHWRGQRRALDQIAVQRGSPHRRSQCGAGELHSHGAWRVFDVGWFCRAESSGRSRHQPARAGNLVPAKSRGA